MLWGGVLRAADTKLLLANIYMLFTDRLVQNLTFYHTSTRH